MSKRIGMFNDVRQVLDAALAAGGGEYELPTHGAAVHWRQRAYQFRKIYAETYGLRNPSKYDKLTFPRIVEHSSTVVIRFVGETTQGKFRPRNANAETIDVPEDELLSAAADFVKKLQGEI